MPRARRKALIEQIEAARGSRVLCYVTGDRAPAVAQIGDDAVRPMYDLLREMGQVEKLDFFIYSRGGAIDVPWRIVTALRTSAKDWATLIPFRANSAATLLALGADEIVLGRFGELGPIDPIMNIQRVMPVPGGPGTVMQDSISVEDVMAYVKFVQERAGLSDQAALATGLTKLTERLDAVTLGSAYRTHSHIRDVARRMLLSRSKPHSEQTMATIVETLAERVYAHGHAIGLKAAKEIGLPAIAADTGLEPLMWDLLAEYESDLKLLKPVDPAAVLTGTDKYSEDAVIAVVESKAAAHEFTGRVEITARRQMPQNLNVAFNLNLQMPPGVAIPAAVQQALQAMMQQAQQVILQQAQQAVQQALQSQAPLVGVEAGFRSGEWKRVP